MQLRAKSDKGHIFLNFDDYCNIVKWCGRNYLLIASNSYNEWINRKCGEIPINEFIDIELIYGREAIILKINGELRYYGDNHRYIKAFKENPGFCMSGAVSVGTEEGSTVTVESLHVTEI